MRIALTTVFVDDQEQAQDFYTRVLGFRLRHKVPVGNDFWLTVVSPEEPEGPELLLEPSGHPAVQPFRDALAVDGIPSVQFTVDDVHAEYDRLRALGVEFTQPPADIGTAEMAVFNDTCGNLVQLLTPKPDVIAKTPGANVGEAGI
ncbi:MAG: VOC family protein [Solirubrobacterales bacterium]|nr:VOC family protein [Solirubrobacterales bacterium]